MKEQPILEGVAASLEPKKGGTRYILRIDDVQFSKEVTQTLREIEQQHKLKGDVKLLRPHDLIRKEKIRVVMLR